MKITLFTSNKSRHNYFINLLSSISKELFVVQESGSIFPGIIPGQYSVSDKIREYFKMVNEAQLKIFGNQYIKNNKKNVKLLPIVFGDLNKLTLEFLSDFTQSDVYIIFGCSYIKGELVEFLLRNNAINIHMGISPFYRGTDCNFWALYDNNPHLVGSTIIYYPRVWIVVQFYIMPYLKLKQIRLNIQCIQLNLLFILLLKELKITRCLK